MVLAAVAGCEEATGVLKETRRGDLTVLEVTLPLTLLLLLLLLLFVLLFVDNGMFCVCGTTASLMALLVLLISVVAVTAAVVVGFLKSRHPLDLLGGTYVFK